MSAPTGTARRWLALASALACAALGCWLVLVFGGQAGWAATGLGLCLAALPVPIYVALVLWIDRFEAEPAGVLAWAFLLGATAAAAAAALANTAVDATLAADPSAQRLALVAGAAVEELAKGCVLVGLWARRPDEFDGVIDGIVYAGMVGLGFAMTENIRYYGFAGGAGGLHGGLQLFILRGCLAPFAHPLFTGITGVALGLAGARRARGWLLAGLGIAAASALHALWNVAAAAGQFLRVYLVVMVPAFVAGLVLIALALRREGRLVAAELAAEVERGRLRPEDCAALATFGGRLRASWAALRRDGPRGWAALRRRQQAAGELALLRARRRARRDETGEPAPTAEELAYLEALSVRPPEA
ncbi:MAG: PrsW family intramembrane metalloprotease [Nannocystaceae bacterium]